MSLEFNADEVLEMAEQIERNGARFYRRAAQAVEGQTVTKLLRELAAWEDGHERVFASFRIRLKDSERQTMTFDPEHETSLYLRAMADGHVFDLRVDPADLLTGRETKEQILKLAIEQEKNSIIFYLGLKEMIRDTGGKEKIDEIIKEEMRHIGFLNKEIAASRNE